jgi:hypothetical protein
MPQVWSTVSKNPAYCLGPAPDASVIAGVQSLF